MSVLGRIPFFCCVVVHAVQITLTCVSMQYLYNVKGFRELKLSPGYLLLIL